MRQLVLYLSLAALLAYGYALAGLGGRLVGRGRNDYIIWGLLAGSACAALALILWRRDEAAEEKKRSKRNAAALQVRRGHGVSLGASALVRRENGQEFLKRRRYSRLARASRCAL